MRSAGGGVVYSHRVTMSVRKIFLVVSTCCFLVLSTVCADVLRFHPEKQRRQDAPNEALSGAGFRGRSAQGWPGLEKLKQSRASKGQPLSFASYYGDHMVLQQGSVNNLWGYADPKKVGQEVTMRMTSPDGSLVFNKTSTVVKGTSKKAIWSVSLSAVRGPYKISVTLGDEHVMISDVLFGDVWLCSGQSNMQFSVPQMEPEDLQRELASAHLYPGVRLFTVKQTESDVPEIDLLGITQPWSVASAESLNGLPWGYFSAVCWLYGRRLYESLGYPIGLVASDYGGTPVKAWSSPDALKVCNITENWNINPEVKGDFGGPTDNSVLWNAMIHPLLNLTIYGAIWYQGEADAGKNNYNCTFPAMIADWRAKFNQVSPGQNDEFPFGFVQLAPWHNSSSLVGGFPSLRWQQTANYGYVPNPKMKNVFMAVSMDLPDFKSPYGRYKETVAERLFLAGLSVAYDHPGIKFQGPLPTEFYAEIEPPHAYIEMQIGSESSELRTIGSDGFEVCCRKNNSYFCEDESPSWHPAPIIERSQFSLTVSADVCGDLWIMGLRYAWKESPCPFKRCSVYSVENNLPAPPFVRNGIFGSTLEGSVSRRIRFHDKK